MKYLKVEPCRKCGGTGKWFCCVGHGMSDKKKCDTCKGIGFVPVPGATPTSKADLLEEWGEKMWFLIDSDGNVQYFYEDEDYAKKMAEDAGLTCRPVHVVKVE